MSRGVNARLGRGVAWTGMQSWGVQGFNLLVFSILAWHVPPEAFGLVALAHVYTSLMGQLGDQGLASALVQRKELEPAHVDSAFWANMVLGVALAAGTFAGADLVAGVMRTPALVPVLRWLSLVFLLHALVSVQDALLKRAMRFRQLAIRHLVATAVGGGLGVALAISGAGVMALVGQQLASAVTGALLLWSTTDWHPRFRFSWAHARDLYAFGSRMVGVRLLQTATRRADDILIGIFLGPVLLGYYAIGYKLMRTLLEMLGKVFTRVAFPAFSSVQDSKAELRGVVQWMMRTASFFAFPCFVLAALLAADIIPFAFGPQWAESIPVLRILAVAGALQVVLLIVNQALMATGYAGWVLRILTGATIASVAGFAVAAVFGGIVWVALVSAVVSALTVPVSIAALRRATGIAFSDLWPALRVPVVSTALMSGVVLLVGWVLPAGTGHLARLMAMASAGGSAYLLLTARLDPGLVASVRSFLTRKGTRRPPRDAAPAAPAEPEIEEPLLAPVGTPDSGGR